ncbi:hypothetical protein D3C85_1729310 [compost metagenome]
MGSTTVMGIETESFYQIRTIFVTIRNFVDIAVATTQRSNPMETILYSVNVILFALSFLIWKNHNWLNFSIKAILFGMFIWNGWNLLAHLGYLVKV